MEQRFYKFFVKNIVQYLSKRGHEIIHENRYGTTLDLNVEKAVVPKFNIGFVQVYFVRDGEIVDKFMTTTNYIRVAERRFKRFYKKRMLATLSEIDRL